MRSIRAPVSPDPNLGSNGTISQPSRHAGTSPVAEHLFALIDLCELIERHKKFILARAEPGETDESHFPATCAWSTHRDRR
jgi:hypothetical protein